MSTLIPILNNLSVFAFHTAGRPSRLEALQPSVGRNDNLDLARFLSCPAV